MKKYELIDHTADIGLQIYGSSREEVFRHAGFALFDIMTDIATVRALEKRTFTLQRDNLEELLVEWMGALLFLFDTEHLLFSRFTINDISDTVLIAEAHGETFDPSRHVIETTVKAVTYHSLSILQQANSWQATVILDV